MRCPIFQTLQRRSKKTRFSLLCKAPNRTSGCQFIHEAFTKGAAFVVTDKMPENINSENIFLVPDLEKKS